MPETAKKILHCTKTAAILNSNFNTKANPRKSASVFKFVSSTLLLWWIQRNSSELRFFSRKSGAWIKQPV